jgi:hypothetical protein
VSLFNKKNVFKFSSTHDGIVSDIKPAKNYVPQWYKSIKSYTSSNIEFEENGKHKQNVKSCIPFLDSLSTGYMVELWCDIHVKIIDDGESHYVTWGSAEPIPVAFRDGNKNPIPIPSGCEPSHYIWRFPYSIKTPPGYSVFITHPLNRFDLPFVTLSGIVDTDNTLSPGNYPFFIKKDFEGIIEKGTPIMQIIPFKRENWISENDPVVSKEGMINAQKSKNTFFGFYKKELWHKKTYE